MLDHVFTDAIGALRTALEVASLERRAVEERFGSDILSGDVRWETSYSLAGEAPTPLVQVDISLSWTTWSQAAYRTWYLNGELQHIPELDLELSFRLNDLERPPDPDELLGRLPDPPTIGKVRPRQVSGPTIETNFTEELFESYAFEVQYTVALQLAASVLADGNELDAMFSALGEWTSSSLVSLLPR